MSTTAKTSTSRSGTRSTALSRERIIKAAYQIALKDPLNPLSMRKIATKLKVTPMAIYKYFNDKDELTAAVIDNHLENSGLVPESDPKDWRSWITSAMLKMWDAYDAAPGMVQYMSQATTFGPAVLSWQNETLKVLIGAGLTPKQALTAHATMSELATGNMILVPIRQQGVQVVFPTIWKDLTEGKVPNPQDLNEKMPMVDYPYLLMCGQAMMEDMQDSRGAFSNGLELILNSLEIQIAANKAK